MVIMRTPNLSRCQGHHSSSCLFTKHCISLTMISNNEKKIDLSMKIKVLDHPKNFGLFIVVVISEGSSLQIPSSSRAQAWGLRHDPEAWPLPIDGSSLQNLSSRSPSRCQARAEPQAWPITRPHQITSVMIIDQSNHVFILSKYKIVSFLLLLSRPPIIRVIIRISNRMQDFFQKGE